MANRTQTLQDKVSGQDSKVESLRYPINVDSEEAGYGHYINFHIYETVNQEERKRDVPIENEEDLSPKDRLGSTKEIRKLAGFTGGIKKTKDLVTLYMPENVTSTYNSQWENGSVQAWGGLAKVGNTLKDVFDKVGNSESVLDAIRSFGGDMNSMFSRENIGDFARNAARVVLADSQVNNSFSAYFREMRNPHMEFLFRGVSPREFTLDFKFTPTSEQEMKEVYKIIKKFKYHMHPEIVESLASGNYYQYPDEFEILFYSHGKQNKWLNCYSNCALTNVTVNYTGAGNVSMFQDSHAPTHVNMSLSFTELELLTKKRINEGL